MLACPPSTLTQATEMAEEQRPVGRNEDPGPCHEGDEDDAGAQNNPIQTRYRGKQANLGDVESKQYHCHDCHDGVEPVGDELGQSLAVSFALLTSCTQHLCLSQTFAHRSDALRLARVARLDGPHPLSLPPPSHCFVGRTFQSRCRHLRGVILTPLSIRSGIRNEGLCLLESCQIVSQLLILS